MGIINALKVSFLMVNDSNCKVSVSNTIYVQQESELKPLTNALSLSPMVNLNIYPKTIYKIKIVQTFKVCQF